ncbi:glycosyltransferase family 4 protein [Victivallis vadensis]|uniref:glycosyltransferase family 4 protein n=1 Tax=Victivallis vadensis TaxID=172901 RepID=UPI0023F55530|nr:glycosyltransferase [Victivallis vadensis]
MKILWVTNIPLPEACQQTGIKCPNAGGWMQALLNEITSGESLRLAVATIYSGKSFQKFDRNGIRYYLLPFRGNTKSNNHSLKVFFQQIIADFQPDITHLHGTEYPWKNAILPLVPSSQLVVSIQGLVGVYARYYLAGLSFFDILRNITPRDILKLRPLWRDQQDFFRRGIEENICLKTARHVIGRTLWDKAHILTVNPECNYHFCNEILHEAFYGPQWKIENIERFSLFMSQGTYPIKGLHIVLPVVAMLKKRYPTIRLYVGGINITSQGWLHLSGYGKLIKRMIRDLDLEKTIYFIGSLTADLMVERYLRSHIFICPSSIENSPNSLGEAQILGVPAIAAFVGGIPDMSRNNSALMYRFEEKEILYRLIIDLFESDEKCHALSEAGRREAQKRHCRVSNRQKMLNIYESIYKRIKA